MQRRQTTSSSTGPVSLQAPGAENAGAPCTAPLEAAWMASTRCLPSTYNVAMVAPKAACATTEPARLCSSGPAAAAAAAIPRRALGSPGDDPGSPARPWTA